MTTDYEKAVDVDRRRQGDDRIQYWVDRFRKQDVEGLTSSQIEQALSDLRASLLERHDQVAKGQRRSHVAGRRRRLGTLEDIEPRIVQQSRFRVLGGDLLPDCLNEDINCPHLAYLPNDET